MPVKSILNSQAIDALLLEAEASLTQEFQRIEQNCHQNTQKVLEAFKACGLDDSHFYSVTGYAHNDMGREATDAIFANVFGADSACVRLQFVSGTHAIAAALRGCLAPGKKLISLTGAPYDTLEPVIGKRERSAQSLTRWGVSYDEIDYFNDDRTETIRPFTDSEAQRIAHADVALIQRSRGYSLRPSLSVSEIQSMIHAAKSINPNLLVIVDNCYGEFIETLEPTAVGADLIAGSLIKNPGGGIVPTGGYIAGRQDLVESAAESLTAPGLGTDGGYTFDATRVILQGLYLAPMIVREAQKGMRLFAAVFENLGYDITPSTKSPQNDIIQAIQLENEVNILAFCKALQAASPVGSKLTPIPAVTPGYESPVVMAGGTFIFGSTIELSADAPIREPYTVFVQGGLNYSHTRYTLSKVIEAINE